MATLVTGANGFVGSALSARLCRDGVSVRGAVRALSLKLDDIEVFPIGSLSSDTDCTEALKNVKQVVHLDARAHVMNDKSLDPLLEFRRVNDGWHRCSGLPNCSRGGEALVFLSSIKVKGEFALVGAVHR